LLHVILSAMWALSLHATQYIRDVRGSIFQNPIQSNPLFILSAKTPSNMFRNLIHFCS